MSAIPKGWAVSHIGALCKLVNGRAFKPSDWTKAGLPIVRIQNLNNPEAPFNYYDGEVKPQFLINDGELLFAWSGTPGTSFGAHIWNGGRAVLNQHIFKVLFDPSKIDRLFLRIAINQKLDELIDKAHGGVGLRHVTKGKFEETVIALPSLTEQRRIVSKLDSLLARSKQAANELSRIPSLADRYKNAVLDAAFRGELTNDNPEKWPRIRLGGVIASIEAGKNLRCEERPPAEEERGIVKVSSVTWGTFDASAAKTPPGDVALNPNTVIRLGDFLISRANTLELVGACVIVSELSHNNLYLSDKVLRIRFTEPVDEWVLHFLRSREGRRQIEELATGNQLSMRNISQVALRAIQLPLPPQRVRQRVLDRLQTKLSGLAKGLADAYHADRLLERFEQAVLAKAFRGDLIAQARNDPLTSHAQTVLVDVLPNIRGLPEPLGA